MHNFRIIIAGAVLASGAGMALAQDTAPADAGQPTAEEATTTTTDAQTDANAAAAGAVVAGSAGAATAASADAQATPDDPISAEELAQQKRAERKAKRRAQCLAINVGKPRDC